jgi:hypothetical protein
MVLSNAERQRRHREKRNRMAAEGVTPEMVDEVAAIVWTRACVDDPSLPPWHDILAECRTKRGREVWRKHIEDLGMYVPDEAEAAELYGESADLVRRVCLVLQAAVVPPVAR